MKNSRAFTSGAFILFLLPGFLMAQGPAVTIYNQDLGLVREKRSFNFKAGLNEISVVDIPAKIDSTSVHVKSLTAPDSIQMLEQNFQYDLISQEKLLDKYIDREIELEYTKGDQGKTEILKGILLSNRGGRILKVGEKIYVNPPGNPILKALPEGLLTRPTLLWKLKSSQAGKQELEMSYLTQGLSWQSDYVAVLNETDTLMDLTAWVTLTNTSGASFKDAKLKLVAGEVNRAAVPERRFARDEMMVRAASMEEAPSQFEEKAFFEYHLYTLERPADIKDNETKQIEMANAQKVSVKKLFIFDSARTSAWNQGDGKKKKIGVFIEFKNSKKNNMGIPLPKGRIRVYKGDADGSQEFIGEDAIDHTPKDEDVRIKMGEAFDVVGERIQTSAETERGGRVRKESYEIKLKNRKDSAVTVLVVEHLSYASNWKILASSREWKKKESQTIEFSVPLQKDEEAVLTYTVEYRW